ncbi:unnamed protein product [Fraxinus pennsylvanica]|uniref:Uncharacterized protein n=1 Tax=Fraxinus pennsylvanica TaxID=56036 RepID=A0AAD2DX86_9LAMI|nr:unnamed protein product [Fraxinus pennsylvanica]
MPKTEPPSNTTTVPHNSTSTAPQPPSPVPQSPSTQKKKKTDLHRAQTMDRVQAVHGEPDSCYRETKSTKSSSESQFNELEFWVYSVNYGLSTGGKKTADVRLISLIMNNLLP